MTSSPFVMSGFAARLVDLRGLAILRLGVAILLGEAERDDLVRVERRAEVGGRTTGGAILSTSNRGGICIWVLCRSLVPFSMGLGSNRATIQRRMPYSSDNCSAVE